MLEGVDEVVEYCDVFVEFEMVCCGWYVVCIVLVGYVDVVIGE